MSQSCFSLYTRCKDMGLTITQSLVELHNGTPDIESKAGKGTIVTVTLPKGTS